MPCALARILRKSTCPISRFDDRSQIRNRLLNVLAEEDFERLRPHLEPVLLPVSQVLSARNQPIDHVYFVEKGMVSVVTPLADRAMIEVGLIGAEGLVGVPVLLGADAGPSEKMVQTPGAWRIARARRLRQMPVVRYRTEGAGLFRYDYCNEGAHDGRTAIVTHPFGGSATRGCASNADRGTGPIYAAARHPRPRRG